jgi:hypothetical protein
MVGIFDGYRKVAAGGCFSTCLDVIMKFLTSSTRKLGVEGHARLALPTNIFGKSLAMQGLNKDTGEGSLPGSRRAMKKDAFGDIT